MTSVEDYVRSSIAMGKHSYGDRGSYKRLSNEELANPKLRPNNRNVASVDSVSYPLNNRPHNSQAVSMFPDEYKRTLYPEERTPMRFENMNVGGDNGSLTKKIFTPLADTKENVEDGSKQQPLGEQAPLPEPTPASLGSPKSTAPAFGSAVTASLLVSGSVPSNKFTPL